jgi:glycosyltransferase involved in cell wall biosynthesis
MTKTVPRRGLRNKLRYQWKIAQYRALSGIIFVSEACRSNFQRDWPEVQTPTKVVYNGLDFTEWTSSARQKEIICVGRATPEKGIREAAEAIKQLVETEKNWKARLILSEPTQFPLYVDEILRIVGQKPTQIAVEFDQPFSVVRESYLKASLAIIPSRWQEPFGRTALEAHAAGCAVISSGTGGLAEISGPYALFLPTNFNPQDIVELARPLIQDDDKRRQLAEAGRRYCAERFSLASIAQTADQFYEDTYQYRNPLHKSKRVESLTANT